MKNTREYPLRGDIGGSTDERYWGMYLPVKTLEGVQWTSSWKHWGVPLKDTGDYTSSVETLGVSRALLMEVLRGGLVEKYTLTREGLSQAKTTQSKMIGQRKPRRSAPI